MVRAVISPLFWLAPLLLHAQDAHAWGLYTHMYFAQLLLWAVPLADSRFRQALRRFPELVLAGACLPDVSLFAGILRGDTLRATHGWTAAHRLLSGAQDHSERAIALGYASHLLVDIVAHNHFVPAHEALWFRASIATHAASEWAMDAHIAPQLFTSPAAMLQRHGPALAAFAERRLGTGTTSMRRALACLTGGERLLRSSGLPRLVYAAARAADRGTRSRFDEYIQQTSGRLRQLDQLIAGNVPAWLPEPPATSRAHGQMTPAFAPFQATLLPLDFFQETRDRSAACASHGDTVKGVSI